MKKLMKEMAGDFFSPAKTTTTTVALVPFAVLVRLEALTDRALYGIKDFISKSGTMISPLIKQPAVDAIPLIKASTPVVEKKHAHFAGRSVLCVGGQIHLYPAYRQIIEDAGARFLSFHGGAETPINNLLLSLEQADMVICPIDCVRHEAFFVTKQHCKRFGKPCVLLDKSRVATFYNGIRMLKYLQ